VGTELGLLPFSQASRAKKVLPPAHLLLRPPNLKIFNSFSLSRLLSLYTKTLVYHLPLHSHSHSWRWMNDRGVLRTGGGSLCPWCRVCVHDTLDAACVIHSNLSHVSGKRAREEAGAARISPAKSYSYIQLHSNTDI